jgi:hypothetical protein
MSITHSFLSRVLPVVGALLAVVATAAEGTGQTVSGGSQLVTWTCVGSPCPWGSSVSAHAVEWPATTGAGSHQLGYTVSKGIYLPSDVANGTTLDVQNGTAFIYAVTLNSASDRFIAQISAGSSYQVSGLTANEFLAVYSGSAFSYQAVLPGQDPGATNSQMTTWSCAGAPCPWGASVNAHAAAWPASAQPVNNQLGYLASRNIYLPAQLANGSELWLASGTAEVFAVTLDSNADRFLGQIWAGGTLEIGGLAPDEFLAVYSGAPFSYEIALFDGPADTIHAQLAYWSCNTPGCTRPDLVGPVIAWPEWSAYSSNNRAGQNSMSVFAPDGSSLHPYMASWANGCQVTVVYGTVIIVEWQRGSETWRETWLSPGDVHTISLSLPEDGAMLETFDSPGFGITLANCTPQPLSN